MGKWTPFANWLNYRKAENIVRTVRISDGSDASDDELPMFYVKPATAMLEEALLEWQY